MDEALLAIVAQLAQITAAQNRLTERLDKFIVDLSEFSERFEDVIENLENERRLDLMSDYN